MSSEGTYAVTAPGAGECQVCGCSDFDPCSGGCVWANPEATLCSRCARGENEIDDAGATHHDNLQAALELGGFEGGVLPTVGPEDDFPW